MRADLSDMGYGNRLRSEGSVVVVVLSVGLVRCFFSYLTHHPRWWGTFFGFRVGVIVGVAVGLAVGFMVGFMVGLKMIGGASLCNIMLFFYETSSWNRS